MAWGLSFVKPGADPGFLVGGSANPPGEWALVYKFPRFVEKLHGIKKILVRRGARAGSAPLDPPLQTSGDYEGKGKFLPAMEIKSLNYEKNVFVCQ